MEGYIYLHRKFGEWQWFTEPYTSHVFIALLLKAAWRDTKWRGIVVKRGQAVIGLPSFSDFCGCSIQRIRTAFARLKEGGCITTEPTNKYTLVTICNYDVYQLNLDELGKQSTNKQQTNNKQTTINQQQLNKVKKVNNISILDSSFTNVQEDSKTLCQFAGQTDVVSGTPQTQIPTFGFEHLVEYWNTKMEGKAIKGISRIPETSQRRTFINARRKEYGDNAIYQAIDNVASSAFLNGNNSHNFTATFDWVFRPNNFPKVLEGNYNTKNIEGEVVDNDSLSTEGHSDNWQKLYAFLKTKEYLYKHMAMVSEGELTMLMRSGNLQTIANAISTLENNRSIRCQRVSLAKTIKDYLDNGRF